MSTKRAESATRKHDHAGAVLCSCGCGRPPVPGRRTWHSRECVEQWRIKNQPSYVRQLVLARDHGVCALCGVDTVEVKRRARLHSADMARYVEYWKRVRADEIHRTQAAAGHRIYQSWSCMLREAGRQLESDRWLDELQSVYEKQDWQADHIVPVCRGGGQCGLENYRTLCAPCHKRVTRELAAERARERRGLPPAKEITAEQPNLF